MNTEQKTKLSDYLANLSLLFAGATAVNQLGSEQPLNPVALITGTAAALLCLACAIFILQTPKSKKS